MRKWLVVMLMVVALPSQGATPTKENLIGTWKLVSAKLTTDKGEVRDSWGPNPQGFLTYTEDGRVMAILTFSNRTPLSVADFISAPEKERAEAFATMTAYAATFSINGDKVTHHVEIASAPNDVGRDLERTIVALDGERLILGVGKPYLRGE